MKADRFGKLALVIVIVLLFLNLINGFWRPATVMAEKENSAIGRYQISAWSTQIHAANIHAGYYIVDTVTGKIVDAAVEFHSHLEPLATEKFYHKIERQGLMQ